MARTKTATATPKTEPARNTVAEIPLTRIHASTLNPRKQFDEGALAELAESIKSVGLIEPIVVRTRPGTPDEYEIVVGERRWRAAGIAGLETVPARDLGPIDDSRALQLALVENLQRQDLDPIEEAMGYASLNRVCGLKQAEIAAAVNRSQPAIANAMRLLELPENIHKKIRAKELSPAHGRALVPFAKWPRLCERLATDTVDAGISSKVLERGFATRNTLPAWEYRNAGLLAAVSQDLDEKGLRDAGITIWGEDRWSRVTPDVDAYYAEEKRQAEERQAKIARQIEAATNTAKAGGKDKPVRLDKLPPGSYTRLTNYKGEIDAPAGCPDDCPCRATAIERDGTVVVISTDRAHIEKLQRAEQRAKTKEVKNEARERAAMLDELLAEAPAFDREGLGIVVANRLCQFKKVIGKRMIEQFCDGKIEPTLLDSYDGRRDTYQQLAKLPIENLIRILVHGELLDYMHDHIQYGTGLPAAPLAWYMESAGQDPFAGLKKKDLEERLREARGRLQDLKIQNQPGLYEKWKETETEVLTRLAQLADQHHTAEDTEPAASPEGTGESTLNAARSQLRAWLQKYEILGIDDFPTDGALLVFSEDLIGRDDLEEVKRQAIKKWMRTLGASLEVAS